MSIQASFPQSTEPLNDPRTDLSGRARSGEDVFSRISGVNRGYAEELMLRAELGEPVDPSWRGLFSFTDHAPVGATPLEGPARRDVTLLRAGLELIRSYEEYGHIAADHNPLADVALADILPLAELGLEFHGLQVSDVVGLDAGGAPAPGRTAGDLLAELRARWCGRISLEFAHLEPGPRALVRDVFLAQARAELESPVRAEILARLLAAEELEGLLATRFLGVKRFSLEGSESLLTVLDGLFSAHGPDTGFSEVVIGMAHRGRFNTLVHSAGFPTERLLAAFADVLPAEVSGAGDVKVHLGHKGAWPLDPTLPVEVAFNPSHLETVSPVVLGMCRVRPGALPVIVHGDAAFCGQGVVAETLQLQDLDGYRVGGAVHVVLDNQVGFTTDPAHARSARFASAPLRAVDVPVIRVNGASAEDCWRAGRLAASIRAATGRDVAVHLVALRRLGHNEGDDPAATQPLLYRRIDAFPLLSDVYSAELAGIGALTGEVTAGLRKVTRDRFFAIADRVRAGLPAPHAGLPTSVAAAASGSSLVTALPHATVAGLLEQVLSLPAGFTPDAKVAKVLQAQREEFAQGSLSWALGESLAYASLLQDGLPVRLAGEDSGRGTFAHRHAVLRDRETGAAYLRLSGFPGRCEVVDSLLSEYAALAFEYGFDVEVGRGLTLWEAQFGDFANGAQIVIDTCLAAGESKWGYRSGLVMLLPHGAEGQGPEHSSARLERFLQLAGGGALRVAVPTTAAQVFHLLRRQALDPVRLPLVVLTPKSQLRTPVSCSRLEEITEGSFLPVLVQRAASPRRVVLAYGKVGCELATRLPQDVTLLRIEEFSPAAIEVLCEEIRLASVEDVVLVQEEMENCGPAPTMLPALHATGLHVELVAPSLLPSNAPGSAAWAAAINRDLQERALR